MNRGSRFSNLVSSYNMVRTSVVNGRSVRSVGRSEAQTSIFAVDRKKLQQNYQNFTSQKLQLQSTRTSRVDCMYSTTWRVAIKH
jgi:hypothetical protein